MDKPSTSKDYYGRTSFTPIEPKRSTSDDEDNDSGIGHQWILVYFPGSEPGNEYEIVNEAEVVPDFLETFGTLQQGSSVQINYGGTTRVSAVIVAISDDKEYLKRSTNELTENFKVTEINKKKRKSLKKRSTSKSPITSDESCDNRSSKKAKRKSSPKDIKKEKCSPKTKTPLNTSSTNTEESFDFSFEIKSHDMDFDGVNVKQQLSASNMSNMEGFRGYIPVYRPVLKIKDQETQTEDKLSVLKMEYNELEKKLEEKRTQYQHLCEIVNELKDRQRNSEDEDGEVDVFDGDKENVEDGMIQIGSNGSKVPWQVYKKIKWDSHTSATKKLLTTLFTRQELATHSLTGKACPAFLKTDRVVKKRLDPRKITDIIECVTRKCKKTPEAMVRQAITSKCADENKLMRRRLNDES
ncbi:uncharacterized protein LOC109602314 isoform X2 [Aethina tumida]|uniref:uncharacterized protein LOC109602314 isoform X2 n=1 Tax=Aethina tumida TaxID=116153 RepID=UPI0021482DA2|nr:uncharacterized protein LOC109602314 isoform X2 [Aethina tumida]